MCHINHEEFRMIPIAMAMGFSRAEIQYEYPGRKFGVKKTNKN